MTFARAISKTNEKNILGRCQFHQHITRSFYFAKLCVQAILTVCVWACIGKGKLAKELHVKCWWNRLLQDVNQRITFFMDINKIISENVKINNYLCQSAGNYWYKQKLCKQCVCVCFAPICPCSHLWSISSTFAHPQNEKPFLSYLTNSPHF